MDERLLQRLAMLPDLERARVIRALVEAGHPVESLPAPRLPAHAPEGFLPLETQRRLLALERLRPNARFNRVSVALALRGPLDAHAFATAFGAVVARHEGLRSLYRRTGEDWRCLVTEDGPSLLRIDLCGEEPDRTQALERYREALEGQPFDVEAGPPWRGALLRLGEDDHALLLCFHHVVADGFAIDIIGRDLSAAYGARRSGVVVPIWASPATRPCEAAAFERDIAAAGLARAPHRLADPTAIASDLLRARAGCDLAGVVARRVPDATARGLAALAHETATSAAAGFVAAALLAIEGLAGSDGVEAAIAVAGRENPRNADLVAPLVRAAPLTFRPSPEDDARATVARAARAVEESAAGGGLAASEPPPCLIVIQNANRDLISIPGVAVSRLPARTVGAHHELVFTFLPDADGWTLELEYALDLFEQTTAEAIADHVVAVAGVLAQRRERPVRKALARDHAAPALESGWSACDDGAFPAPVACAERAALARPDAPAVLTAEGDSFSYGAVLAAARRLAQGAFAPSGSDASCPVALLAEHGPGAVLAMLAAAMAGRAFVVIDAEAGPARARAMLAASGAGLLAFDRAHSALADALAADGMVRLATLRGIEAGDGVLGPEPGPAPQATPGDSSLRPADGRVAYLAFTSGSTGEPKGIVQSERSLAQFLAWQEQAFAFGPGGRIAMWSSLAFDACYTEVFGALGSGATLCIPPHASRGDPAAMARWLRSAEIDYFLTIPSFLALVLGAAERAGTRLDRLRDVATSGEPMAPGLARRLARVASGARLHNLYGPTEAILATCHTVPADHPEERRVPVGRPLAGRRIVLLDRHGDPVARGTAGEIAIISAFLADGYLAGDPERRFRTIESGERLYLTGDIGRVGADGHLYFLGRCDAQAKIRGVRVDLAEIAMVLERRPDVSACSVVAIPGPTGMRLVAHVATPMHASEGAAPRIAAPGMAAAFRATVVETLGARAAPAVFVTMAALPRTTTGKIDVRRLEALDPSTLAGADVGSHLQIAAAGAEALIAEAWHTVLGHTPSREQPFFDAGGDSLLAVRLHAALEAALPGRFALVDVFANPTIAALAAAAALGTGDDPTLADAGERARRRLALRRARPS